ncbi:MAG: hypothetical protein GY935_16660 [Gammaproteobacteria bacterium]|nr:hypothetical protein [Gammaproteobacteria bacterium]
MKIHKMRLIADLDREISDQLREDMPLFGSTQSAVDASRNLGLRLEVKGAISMVL